MTEGEYRVGVTFNPSADDRVTAIKSTVAYLINEMHVIASDRSQPGAREAAIAATAFEDAAMWAVKALTKPERPA